ncbi:V-type ATPase subunit [Ruminococcus sp.]|uniref:V0D/AC39 family V-type ATPase subunit n=1 Tax=Ruminococcus sp. TaxID=41978 RepID=UPI0025CC4A9E|nr:V-type ATPase subunit [Ruminococcus sp.]
MSTEFANAVAAVRAMESTLLTQSDMERMAAAENTAAIAEILTSCGRTVPRDKDELLRAMDEELEAVWEFLSDYAPENQELEILVYRNNFHNLKAALKALIMDTDAQRLFLRPTSLSLNELPGIVAAKHYDMLPVYMQETAMEAYDILTRTLDGQLADAVLDTAALQAMQTAAEQHKSEFMQKYAQLITVCADMKTAYRCSMMQKSENFLDTAICGSRELDKTSLVRAAARGTDALFTYLGGTPYSEAAEALTISPARFEKWCDDAVISLAEEAKLQSFGIEPLAAYYLAKETEVKNLRILLVCKSCGAVQETITERMRKLYV